MSINQTQWYYSMAHHWHPLTMAHGLDHLHLWPSKAREEWPKWSKPVIRSKGPNRNGSSIVMIPYIFMKTNHWKIPENLRVYVYDHPFKTPDSTWSSNCQQEQVANPQQSVWSGSEFAASVTFIAAIYIAAISFNPFRSIYSKNRRVYIYIYTCETRVQEKNAMDHLGLKKRDEKQKLR